MDKRLIMAAPATMSPRTVAQLMPSEIFRAVMAVEARGTLRHRDVKLYFQALELDEDQIEMVRDLVPPSRDGQNTSPEAEMRWERLMDGMREITSPDVFEKAAVQLDEAVRKIRIEFGEEAWQSLLSEGSSGESGKPTEK